MKKIFACLCCLSSLGVFLACAEQAFAVSVATTVTVSIVPNAPTNLTAVPDAPTQVSLSWTNNMTSADEISVERRTGVAGTYAEIATTSAMLATYTDNAASPSTIYFYRVRTYANGVYSPYSNEASVSTPSSGNGGNGGNGGGNNGGGPSGGGGSGGYIPPVSPTNVMISGVAYPESKVFILRDGQVVLQTIAGPDANFSATIGNLGGGNYVFSVYSEDDKGNQSTVFTFPVMVTPGATTIISGIFLSPTIDVDKEEVKQGDTLVIFGESVPSSTISIQVNSAQAIFAHATSSASGAYVYDLDTSVLAMGSHSTKAKAVAGATVSQDSFARTFLVGTQDVSNVQPATCPPNYPKADLNSDCHVNLVDFSMLAYWYQRPNPPVAYRLDGNPTIDLRDFSIMAYYWTG